MHSFFGSRVTNAYTDVSDLLAGASNCNPAIDTSSYWVPTFYVDNAAGRTDHRHLLLPG